MLAHLVMTFLLLVNAEGHRHGKKKNLGKHRYRRDEDVGGVVYAPCKDTYSQCAEWNKSGMCEMPQYKDYMPLVCTDTCGFCKPRDNIETAQQEAAKVAVNPDTATKDKIQQDYEAELKKYYENLEGIRQAYQQRVATETATANSAVSLPATATDVGTAASNQPPLGPPPGMVMAHVPYNPYPGYPAYPAAPPPAEEGSSPSALSSPSASSPTDVLPGATIAAGFAPQNGTERNASSEGSPSLPTKVAFETPSLPALPPLLALPSESLQKEEEETAMSNSSSVEKAPTEKEKLSEQEEDSKLLEKEPDISTKEDTKQENKKEPDISTKEDTKEENKKETDTSPKEDNKEEKKKKKHVVKAESDRKITTQDVQTNEMEKVESKHLAASTRHNLDKNNGDDGENADAKKEKEKLKESSPSESAKLKGNTKIKDSESKQSAFQHKTPGKESENDDDEVYKHDSEGGSGEDLNYITDFNPAEFDMDEADLTRKKDLVRLHHDKRNLVQFPPNHPLYAHVQKARSEITTAPRIIDVTDEDDAGDNSAEIKVIHKANVHSKLKSSFKRTKKDKIVSHVQKARNEITAAPRIIDATDEGGIGDNCVEGKVPHKANIHSKLKSSSKHAKKDKISKSGKRSFLEKNPDHENEEEKVESADRKAIIKIEDLDKSKPEEVKPEQSPIGNGVKKAKLKEKVAKKLLSAKSKVNKIRKQKEKKETAVKKEKVDKSEVKKETAVKKEKVDKSQEKKETAVKKEKVNKSVEKKEVVKKENVDKSQEKKETAVKKENVDKSQKKKETAVKKEKVDKSQEKNETAVKKEKVDKSQEKKETAVKKEKVNKSDEKKGTVVKKENVDKSQEKKETAVKKEKVDKSQERKETAVKKENVDKSQEKKETAAKNETLVKKEKLPLKKKMRVILHEESSMTPVKKSNKDPKPTIGMKSKISINFRKKDAILYEKSTTNSLEKATKPRTVIVNPNELMIVRESISHENISTKAKIERKKESNVAKTENKQVKNKINKVLSMKGEATAKRSKQIVREKKHLETKKESPITKVAEKSKEPIKPKKRTSDPPLNTSDIEATLADFSGAGSSGEIDTAILSGDSRSDVESGDDEEDEEEDSEPEEPTRLRQNVHQLHGDPEMVDLTPQEIAEQPDLNDFPDKDAATIKKGSEKEGNKKHVSPDDEADLDDIKIEELLNPKPEAPKKTKKKAAKEAEIAYKTGKVSLVMQQNFNSQYEKLDSPGYHMLSGNIKKDIEKMITGTAVNDVTFSEVSVEGNPRTSGKTKANFNIKAPSTEWMKQLLKLVDSGDIDGLRVIKGSLEIEEQ